MAGGKLSGIESYQPQQFFHASGNSRGVPFFESGDECDVLRDGEMRKETCFLYDVADAAAEADGITIGSGTTLNENLALRRYEHAIDEFEQGGFAAAAATQKD